MKITKSQIRELIKEELKKIQLSENYSEIPEINDEVLRRTDNWIRANSTALKPVVQFKKDDHWDPSNPKANAAIKAIKAAYENPEVTGPDIKDVNLQDGATLNHLAIHISNALNNFPEWNRQRRQNNVAAANEKRNAPQPDETQKESKKSENEMILENHRKNRKTHPIAKSNKNNWWFDA